MLKRIIVTFLALFSIIYFGAIALTFAEKISFWEALYLTIQTVTTVGFGDIVVSTTWGQIIIFVLMIGGVGLMLYSLGLVMAFIIEGQLANVYGRRIMKKKIGQLRNHIIVCGAGRVGWQVVQRLHREGAPFVVIDQDEDLVSRLLEEGYLAVHGDATLDEVLVNVQIEHAKGLITTLPEDALNVFVTLTAKGLNPDIKVVARMDKLESEKKLRHSGADKIISPAILGGSRMAMSILKPTSMEYIETLLHDYNIEIDIEEFRIKQDSILAGKTLGLSALKEKTGAIIIAIARGKNLISNPDAEEVILSGDLLIVLGKKEQLQRLEQIAESKESLKV
ncbi:MAG TPA: potassium channel protein [Desulfitobacteriaceae bacterium]|nr:potassium channel protein [Desulfitobacteriaceae bacterium]